MTFTAYKLFSVETYLQNDMHARCLDLISPYNILSYVKTSDPC